MHTPTTGMLLREIEPREWEVVDAGFMFTLGDAVAVEHGGDSVLATAYEGQPGARIAVYDVPLSLN